MPNSPEKPKKYEEKLMHALGFDDYDLEANRAGKLTPRQMIRLNAARTRAITLWIFPTVIVAVVLAIWLGLVSASVNSVGDPAALQTIAFGALAAVALYFFFGLKSRRLEADMRERQILTVEGPVDLVVSGIHYAEYFLRVGDLRFPIKKAAFLAFKNGDPYRVYFTTRSKQILAVEWLRENDDNLIDEESSEGENSPLDAESWAVSEKLKHQS